MKKSIWILLDNRIGSRHQAEGVAHYLDKTKFEVTFKEVEYTKWAALPNLLRGRTLIGISSKSVEELKFPFPDFVLSASRRCAPVARWIKKQNPSTKLIQLLHIGRVGAKDFTAIFTPEHDNYKYHAPNIRYTVGSPHFITSEKLNSANNNWKDKFANLPHPITALIIGGSIKKHLFSIENAKALAEMVKDLKTKDGGSLLITTSRRTGLEAEKAIMEHLHAIPNYAYLWGNKGENPYLGFLACADNLVVTGDSVSMCCEATATGKPLAIFTGHNWLTPKHLRFVQTLYEKHYASDLSDITEFKKDNTTQPLNVAQEIAAYISNM